MEKTTTKSERKKTIPTNRAAETAVIGSMLVDAACIPVVAEIITADDFADEEIKTIFTATLGLWQKGDGGVEGIDAVLVRTELNNLGFVQKEFLELMAKAMETVPSSANAEYYAKAVKRASAERQLWSAVEKISNEIHSGDLSLEQKTMLFEQAAVELEIHQGDSCITIEQAAEKTFNELETLNWGLSTGFERLDDLIYGMAGGDLIILAGRPSMGKSSLANDIALNVCRNGHKAAIYSLEMNAQAITLRFMCSLAQLDIGQLRRGNLLPKEAERLVEAVNKISNYKMWINDNVNITPSSLSTHAMRLHAQQKLDLIVIDYLQLINPDTTNRQLAREQQVTSIVRSVKHLAKRLNIPILLLCQLNRAPDIRPDHRPKLSDLRESGSIEQDADKVLFLYRDDYYRCKEDPESKPDGKAVCIVAKHRQGPTGDVPLIWVRDWFSFKNPQKDMSW